MKMRLYTATDIKKRTGLSRKDLAKYEDVVPPVDRMGTGRYKLYDETCVEKWNLVALFRQLGFEKPVISRILNDPDFDRKKAIADALAELRHQKDICEKRILFLEDMQREGITNLNLYRQEHPDLDRMTLILRNESFQAARKKLEAEAASDPVLTELGKGFTAMRDLPPDSPAVQALVERLRRHLQKTYGFEALLLLNLTTLEQRSDTKSKMEIAVSRAVDAYLSQKIQEFMDAILEPFFDAIDNEECPDSPAAKAAVENFLDQARICFGEGADLVFQQGWQSILFALRDPSDSDEDEELSQYLVDALDAYFKDLR